MFVAKVFSQKHSSTSVGNGGIYSVGTDSVYQKWQSGKKECFAGRPYPWNTRENQLSPSCPNSSHSSHVQGTCFTSRETYSRSTCENNFSLQLHWVFTHSLSHTTLTNKSHIKYRVHKIEQNYKQIWHRIKANKNIVVNYNFTISPFGYSVTKPLKQTLDLNVSLETVAKLTHI